MAQRLQTLLVSDLSGEELGTEGVTVTFGYQGATYEIDLSKAEAEELANFLGKYMTAGRRVAGRRRPLGAATGPAPSTAGRTDLAKIREWAKENGYKVSDRGRVSKEIQEAYAAAHS